MRRIRILWHWLMGRRNGISFQGLVSFLKSPSCAVKAMAIIESIEADGDDWRVRLRGVFREIFFPKEIDLFWLRMVVSESMNPLDWHYYEVPETSILPNDVVVDCGSAEGLFSLLVAGRCKEVYAIEPLPRFQKTLHRTFLGITSVRILGCALGRARGELVLEERGIESSLQADGKGVRVPVETIDTLFFDQKIRFDYLKADLEGYELEMLHGARRSIEAFSPRIAITTYHHPSHAQKIEELLKSIHPRYQIRVKGIEHVWGAPVMLHAWVQAH